MVIEPPRPPPPVQALQETTFGDRVAYRAAARGGRTMVGTHGLRFEPAPPAPPPSVDPHDDLVGARVVAAPPADVALFGLPYDGAVLGRKGARLGPDAIRAQLRRLKLPEGAPRRWLDLGNARVPDEPAAASETAAAAMRAALATGAFPVALGGDHSLTFGLVKAVAEARGPVAVLNIDAHLDVREAAVPNSGTSFRRLVDAKVVPAEWITEVGVREFANSPHYIAWARRAGMHVHPSLVLPELPASATGGLYISLDIDVLDESAAPGVSAPTPGGPSTRELFAYLQEVAHRLPVVAMDVVETCPPLDVDDRTARAAAWSVLSVVSARRRAS
jgi:formiminoglutamase/agmatinase